MVIFVWITVSLQVSLGRNVFLTTWNLLVNEHGITPIGMDLKCFCNKINFLKRFYFGPKALA